MTTGHVFIATSLDGFVARTDHTMDWLNRQIIEGEDHGFEKFMGSVDGLVMGSGSFKNVLTFGDWPYQKHVKVMSQSLNESDIPADLNGKVSLTRLSPKELMSALNKEGWKRAYVDGGQLVQSFIREGLIEDVTLTLVPILIGSGLRLFGEVDRDIDLQLRHSLAFGSGMVQNHYKLIKSD